jgi:spermidine synthase
MTAPHSRTADRSRAASKLLPYLPPTAVICGAAVMLVEVLGSRLIGPFFGVGLFVWTALIGVTLVALALGYLLGGLAADWLESPDYLYAAIIVAGALVAAIPLLEAPVLKASMPLGLRAGALASAFCLFAPALLLLGAVSPWLLRIAAHEVHNLGRIAGGLYALSTLGSFAGTLATGFFLIGVLGVHRIFQLGGAVLIALGAAYFVLYRRRWLVAAALAWPLLVATTAAPLERQMTDGTRVRLVHSRDSFYGSVKVVDYLHGSTHTRELIIDGLVQGGMDLRTGESVYEYAYLLQHLPMWLHPEGVRCLVIGLGAGLVPRWYRARGIETDAVDIDPEVVAAARTWFALDPGINVFVADARYHLATTETRYDYVVLDVFNGDTTPAHLLSREAMQLIRARMTARGVLAVNLVGDIGPDGAMTASVVRTLREVFERVQVHPTFVPEQDGPAGNLVLVAQSGPVPATVAHEMVTVHPLAQRGVHYGLAHQVEPQAVAQAIVLTDDFNPIDLRDLALKERVRRRILETTHWDILLGARTSGGRPSGA